MLPEPCGAGVSILDREIRISTAVILADKKPQLAYALTVHKAQGSEFDKVFVIIPNPCRILSRELLYTALTRQNSRLVLFCQGEPHKLMDYRHLSDAARRLTNLFEAPEPVLVGQKIYDDKHIHRSKRGDLMISKSEVIIANELATAGIVYEYVAQNNCRPLEPKSERAAN